MEVKAGVDKINKIGKGALLVEVHEEEAAVRLKTLITDKIGKNYNINLTKLSKPRLVITGLTKKYENDEESLYELCSLNANINKDDCINIKYTRQSNYTKKWILYIETKPFRN